MTIKTKKDEAIELILSFYPLVQWKLGQEDCFERAKECSLITVNKLIESCEFDIIYNPENKRSMDKLNYWDEIKTEIIKLEKNELRRS